jgi:hypothetical protein
MPHRDAVKEDLLKSDPLYQQLHEQHQALERQLDALNHKSLHAEDDEIEMKRIKVEKLRLKDAMEQMVRTREESHVTA